MIFSIIPTGRFRKEAKRLIKKFPSLKNELSGLSVSWKQTLRPEQQLENNIYKIRIAIKSKGKGKSGGARVITYVITENKEIYLLTIYDKSEMDNIDDKTLEKIIENIIQSW